MDSKRRFALGSAMLAVAAAVALSACGFQLRGSGSRVNLPFKTLHLGFPDTSSLGNELKRNIRSGSGTTLVVDPKAAEASVELLSEAREKLTLTLNTQGRIREYSLLYKVSFQVRNNQGKELLAPTEVVLKRDISFNESQVMAKEKEEELLYRDMQSDLVKQILRRLAALKPV
jgi:LPS-assembly lipoprotein